LERGAIEEPREAVVRGDFREPPAFQERNAVGVLERVAAGATDQVRAQQHEQRVDRHRGGDRAQQCRRGVGADEQQVGAQRRRERQPEHEVEVERGEQQPRRHQRQLRRSRLHGHEDRPHAEQRRRRLDRRLIPALVQSRSRQHHHDQHQRQLQAEAPDVRARKTRAHQQPVIDHRKAQHRGQRHHQAHADPRPGGRAVTQ